MEDQGHQIHAETFLLLTIGPSTLQLSMARWLSSNPNGMMAVPFPLEICQLESIQHDSTSSLVINSNIFNVTLSHSMHITIPDTQPQSYGNNLFPFFLGGGPNQYNTNDAYLGTRLQPRDHPVQPEVQALKGWGDRWPNYDATDSGIWGSWSWAWFV